MLSAALAVLEDFFAVRGNRRGGHIGLVFGGLSTWSPAVVGPLLIVGGAVLLAGPGAGRLSWLSIVCGVVCLLVFAYLSLLREVRKVGSQTVEYWTRENVDGQDSRVPGSRITREEVAVLLARNRWERSPSADEADLAGRIALAVRAEVVKEFDQARSLSASAIADAVYWTLVDRGVLSRRTVESFEDFANSMVHAGVWTQVSVFTADDDGMGLKGAVVAVLREFGLGSVAEEPPVLGSWFQRFWARSREIAGSESMRGRLLRLEEAVQLEYLGKRRAEIDKAKAESVAALLGAMKEQKNAVIRIGSIIAIKTEDDLVVWTISEMEAAALEKNSQLLGDPVSALKFLRGSRQGQESTDLEPPVGDILNG